MNIVLPQSGTRHLQRTLYLKAKRDKAYCFYSLYDKIYRPDILQRAYDLVRGNGGTPGVDGRTCEQIESEEGRESFIRINKSVPFWSVPLLEINMKNILFVIIAIVALYYFKPELFPFGGGDSGAYDGAGNPQVVIFTFPGCGAPCNDALNLLRSKGIPFENVDVAASPENEKRLRSMGGGNSMPLTFIGDQRVDGFERTKLTHALAAAYGLSYLDASQREAVQTHFEADGSPKLVMYATDWCPYCQKAREHFAANNISYTEVDVEKSYEGERRYKALKSSGYPLIYVGVKRIQGFDKKAIEKEISAL